MKNNCIKIAVVLRAGKPVNQFAFLRSQALRLNDVHTARKTCFMSIIAVVQQAIW